jgi:6-phosphofructokinase
MRIGLLTGGGDCPGLNAAIRAIARIGRQSGDEIIGYSHGWRGLAEGEGRLLTPLETKGILQSGGTILKTARYHPDEHAGGTQAVFSTLERDRLDAIIVIGGDGTLGSASHLARAGLPVIGIPKTIDNDVAGTQRSIGFDTALSTASEAIDRVHTTGESHDRLMVVEVMGRSTGWLALSSGIASGADAICVPEQATDLGDLAKALRRRHDEGSTSSVVVVAEGADLRGAQRLAGESAGALVSRWLAEVTGFETRLTVLGHIQRGGTPSAYDRLLASAFGVLAVEAAHRERFASLVALRDDLTRLVPLSVVEDSPKPASEELLSLARKLTLL